MDQLDQLLAQSAIKACSACFGATVESAQIQVQQTRKEFEGDRTIVAFPLTRHSRKSPEETGEALGSWLVANDDLISAYQVVKGFLNLTIVPTYWTEKLLQAHNNPTFGRGVPKSKPKVMVEYSSPNTNKPLHLGHLRNNFWAIAWRRFWKQLDTKSSKSKSSTIAASTFASRWWRGKVRQRRDPRIVRIERGQIGRELLRRV